MKKSFILFCIVIMLPALVQAQLSRRVLFLGNSYTATNNLPQMVASMASSTNDTLVYDSYSPGGYTLRDHATDPTSLNKIVTGSWNYVVLQEQSQIPSFPSAQVDTMMFPYGRQLDELIDQTNPCTETVLYMTWGRKNGDAVNCPNWPPVCTYNGMDSLIKLRYMMLADTMQGEVSPVGAVWHYLRTYHPNIELYQPDESHPSVAGTYAAALTFYTVFFRKNPAIVSFNSTLSSADANIIKNAVAEVLFNHFEDWFVGRHDVKAIFNYNFTNANTVEFRNYSKYAQQFSWHFGDGDSSALFEPTHQFANGLYTVLLKAKGCGRQDTMTAQIQVGPVGINDVLFKNVRLYPNPFTSSLTIEGLQAEILDARLYNLLGQSMPISIKKGVTTTIAAPGLPIGTYLLQINTDKGSFSRKISKQ